MTSNLQAMHKMYIVLGDWSCDGHEKSDTVLIETNVTVEELRAAYLQSVATTGFDFSEELASDYEDGSAPIYRLRELGCPSSILDQLIENNYGCSLQEAIAANYIEDFQEPEGTFTHDTYIATLMWFISLSLPDLHWTSIDDTIPKFNGWWGPLNISLGYGLYS